MTSQFIPAIGIALVLSISELAWGAQAIVINKCPGRVWYRLNQDTTFIGKDIGPGETQSVRSENKLRTIQGQLWEKGTPEIWAPVFTGVLESEANNHRVVLTPLFGPRPALSIKVYMACLAGPADPLTRNDITLIDKLNQAGVPRENIWLLLERQCTPSSILATLADAVSDKTVSPDDLLFIYLGGHGSGGDQYRLATWQGPTSGTMILKAIENCPCRIFMVVDSCYSGQMIEDAKLWFSGNKSKPRLSILTSIQANASSTTGWKLIAMLIEEMTTGRYVTPQSIGTRIVRDLRTSTVEQRAQYYDFE